VRAFATDATHIGELRDQHTKTTALIELRRDQYRQRTGRELTDDNVWIRERLRELNSLAAILERLASEKDAPTRRLPVPAPAKRLPLQVIATRGAHDSALRKAHPRTQQ
jgi:hypothetical protein